MPAERSLTGYVVPHAPVLVDPALQERPWLHLLAACRELVLAGPQVIVLCSSHGTRTGVYRSVRGSLGPQGLADISADRHASSSAARLAEMWGRPLLDDPVDHGVVVPLQLGLVPENAEVIACCLTEWTGQIAQDLAPVLEGAASLAAAVRGLSGERDVAFMASAHGSAALTPRAPLTERPEGIEFEKRLQAAFRSDVAAISGFTPSAWLDAGSCGAGPLTALGELVDGPADMIALDDSYGVGYYVARWS